MTELASTSARERNALWHRYSELGKLEGYAWTKQKVYDELKAAGVEQRFLKTAIYEGFELNKLNIDLRDILINNGLITPAEFWAGKFQLDLDQWLDYYSTFNVKVLPLASRETRTVARKRKAKTA